MYYFLFDLDFAVLLYLWRPSGGKSIFLYRNFVFGAWSRKDTNGSNICFGWVLGQYPIIPLFSRPQFLFIGSQKQESDGTFHFCCLASIFGLLDQLHLYLVSTCHFPELTLTHVPENLFFLILSFYSVAGLVNSFLLTSAFYDFWSRQKENQVNMASKIYHFVWHIGEVISFPYVWNLFVRTQPTNEDFRALA